MGRCKERGVDGMIGRWMMEGYVEAQKPTTRWWLGRAWTDLVPHRCVLSCRCGQHTFPLSGPTNHTAGGWEAADIGGLPGP